MLDKGGIEIKSFVMIWVMTNNTLKSSLYGLLSGHHFLKTRPKPAYEIPGQDLVWAGKFWSFLNLSLRAPGAQLGRHITNAGPQLSSFGPKMSCH